MLTSDITFSHFFHVKFTAYSHKVFSAPSEQHREAVGSLPPPLSLPQKLSAPGAPLCPHPWVPPSSGTAVRRCHHLAPFTSPRPHCVLLLFSSEMFSAQPSQCHTVLSWHSLPGSFTAPWISRVPPEPCVPLPCDPNVVYPLLLSLLAGLATLLALAASLHLISWLFVSFSRSLTKRLNKTICSTARRHQPRTFPADDN